MRALWILPLLVATSAHADDTFEAKAATAQRLGRVDGLVWALTARCDAGDNTEQRQCRQVRDRRAAELAGATLLVEADRDAFSVGAWNPKKKSVPLSLSGCIRCSGLELDGTTYYVVAAKPGTPLHVKAGKLDAGLVYDNARPLGDENAAKVFVKAAGNTRVQMLVRVPAKPTTTVGGKPVIALDLVGYRVIAACDGSIVASSPPSVPAAPDKKQCAPSAAVAPPHK